MLLTNAQIYTLARATVLLPHCADLLSDFEVETLAEVSRRFLRHGREAATTADEWAVVDFAVDLMSTCLPARRQEVSWPRPATPQAVTATPRPTVRRMGGVGR